MANDLAGRIRETREKHELSARALSDRAGLADGYIALIESGLRPNPSGDVLLKIARALGVSVDWLLTGEEPSSPALPTRGRAARRAAGS